MIELGDQRDNVVPFGEFRKDMAFPCVAEVRAYWEALRAGRVAPARSEVDPRGIERALEYAFILERIAPRVARFRLAGMHLNDLMGMEVRGMPLTSFFRPEIRNDVAEVVDTVFTGPQIVDMSLAGATGMGCPPLEARLLILPLRSDLGDMNRALGCFVSQGAIGRTPRKFEVTELKTEAIPTTAHGRFAKAPVAGGRNAAKAGSGFAEPMAPYGGQGQQTIRSRGHLRLVVSDE
ncbi:MAG: PAS domain-containing protein [Rhodobacteraceae bacterium]|nr:PAS domain-containing protein [Paracoccaceae bacterium]